MEEFIILYYIINLKMIKNIKFFNKTYYFKLKKN